MNLRLCLVATLVVLVTLLQHTPLVRSLRYPPSLIHDVAYSFPCALNGSQQILTAEQLSFCMQNIPFEPLSANSTIASLREVMQIYVFRDIVQDSPTDIISLSIDIDAELEKIGSTAWSSDYEFQQAISNLYMSLRDPHTLYIKPNVCYEFSVVQPFTLGFVVENGKQLLYVAVAQFGELYQSLGFANISSLAGQQVIAIDNMDPIQAVINFGGFISKDNGSLFNWALQTGFNIRNQVIFGLPESNNMTWSFANGMNVTLPWIGLSEVAVNFTNCNEAQEERNYGLAEMRKSLFGSPFTKPKREFKQDDIFHHEVFEQLVNDAAPPSNQTQPLYESDDISVYAVTKEILAMQITSFEPQNNSFFLDVVWETLNLADAFDIPYLILDLRGNGGGDICLGYQVINSLMEEHNPYGHYDIIHSALGVEVFTALAAPQFNGSFGSPEEWINPITQEPYENISWYIPGVQHTRGGIIGNYSQLVHIQCDAIYSPVNYLFKKILLFTDGLCGSTCAVFSSHLAMADHVDTVVMGGFLNTSQQYFSFPGGQVFEFNELLEVVQSLNITPPAQLANGADMTFALQEIYSWNASDPDIPLEFLFKPADFRLFEWTYQSMATLYTQVAQYFPPLN